MVSRLSFPTYCQRKHSINEISTVYHFKFILKESLFTSCYASDKWTLLDTSERTGCFLRSSHLIYYHVTVWTQYSQKILELNAIGIYKSQNHKTRQMNLFIKVNMSNKLFYTSLIPYIIHFTPTVICITGYIWLISTLVIKPIRLGMQFIGNRSYKVQRNPLQLYGSCCPVQVWSI